MVHCEKKRDDLVLFVFLKAYKRVLLKVISLTLVALDGELLLNKLVELKVALQMTSRRPLQ